MIRTALPVDDLPATLRSPRQQALGRSVLAHLDTAGGALTDPQGRTAGQLRAAVGNPNAEVLREVLVDLEADGWLWREVEARLCFVIALAWVPRFSCRNGAGDPPTIVRPRVYAPTAGEPRWRVVFRDSSRRQRNRFFAHEPRARAFAARPSMQPTKPARRARTVQFHTRLPDDLHRELVRLGGSDRGMNSALVDALRKGLER